MNRWLPYTVAACLAVASFAACTQNPQSTPTTTVSTGAPATPAPVNGPNLKPVAYGKITFVDDSQGQPSATLGTKALTGYDANFIQIKRISVNSFTQGARPPGGAGFRYVSFTYAVRNANGAGVASTLARSNLTFIPVSISSGANATLNTPLITPVSFLGTFGGTTASPSIAQDIIPTHGSRYDPSTDKVEINDRQADLQVFSEADLNQFVTGASGWPSTHTAFPYGFVVRNKNNTSNRTLPANPATNQFDGLVTFGFKVPLTTASTADPFSYTIQFVLAQDTTTGVTKGNEESTATRTRDTANVVGGTVVGGADFCKIRVVGAAGGTNKSLSGFGLGAAGAVDPCFGQTGGSLSTLDFAGGNDLGKAMAIQADGKTIVAGDAYETVGGVNFAVARFNTDGTPDTTFSGDGKTTLDFAGADDSGNAIALQDDGKMLVAGSATEFSVSNFAVARFNTDGTTDTSFSGDGKTMLAFALSYAYGGAMVLQPDGKILIAGVRQLGGDISSRSVGIARLNADGTTDATFDGDGQVVAFAGFRTVEAMALQPDGKFVVAGSSNIDGSAGFAVARFNADGTVDTTFNGVGSIQINFSGAAFEFAHALVLQADGKILVAGGASTGVFAVARLKANGTLDSTFGGTGKTTILFTGAGPSPAGSGAQSMALQPDGKILLVGFALETVGNFSFAVARLNTDGTVDNSFSGDGGTTLDFSGGSDSATAVAIRTDGKILVAGSTSGAVGASNFALAKLNADGSIDPSSSSGKTTLDFAGTSDYASATVLQPDGKILVAGSTNETIGGGNFAVARFNTDGTVDNTFSSDGKTTLDFGGGDDGGSAIVLQSDGKILVAGYSSEGVGGYNFAVARFNADGAVDNTFSADGKTTLDFAGANDFGRAMVLQPDGKILVAGTATETIGGVNFALARFNTDGMTDTSFSGDGKTAFDFAGANDSGNAIALQADGKVLVAGTATETIGGNNFAVARFGTDGTTDSTFNGSGKTTIDFSGSDSGSAMAVQADGKILITGSTQTTTGGYGSITFIEEPQDSGSGGPSNNVAIARLNANGALDTTFSGNGRTTIKFPGIVSTFDVGRTMALQADGKILVAGTANETVGNYNFAVARVNVNGSLDNTFGGDGGSTLDIAGAGNLIDVANAVVVQGDGRVVVAGTTNFLSSSAQVAVARFYP
jgi:uncharacterized delta-60 repeat protein